MQPSPPPLCSAPCRRLYVTDHVSSLRLAEVGEKFVKPEQPRKTAEQRRATGKTLPTAATSSCPGAAMEAVAQVTEERFYDVKRLDTFYLPVCVCVCEGGSPSVTV